jgi:drug/metabolite transporter (DMT)-like permease
LELPVGEHASGLTVGDAPLAAAERRRELVALGAALVVVCFWASAFVGIRSVRHGLSPGSLALGRLLVGSVVLGAILAVRRERLPARADLRAAAPGLLVAGVFWLGLYNLMLNAGERRVDAGTAAMLVNVGPVIVAVLAGLLLGEGFPRTLLAGCAIAFAGVVVIALGSAHGRSSTLGTLLCVASAFAYSAGVIGQKRVVGRVAGLQLTLACCLIGAVVCLPAAPSLVHQLSRASASTIGWLLYLGVVPTALGFALWAAALARTSAGRLASTTYLVPAISVLLGWAILGETPAGLALAGGAPCLAGVAVARR